MPPSPRSLLAALCLLAAAQCSSPAAKCQGKVKNCSDIESNVDCESQLACRWEKAHCDGVRLVSCRILDGNQKDCEAVGCTYGRVENFCEGKYNSFDCKFQGLDTQRLCQLFDGCRWEPGDCTGYAWNCDELEDAGECSTQIGCEWK